jgi:hypothetical protein
MSGSVNRTCKPVCKREVEGREGERGWGFACVNVCCCGGSGRGITARCHGAHAAGSVLGAGNVPATAAARPCEEEEVCGGGEEWKRLGFLRIVGSVHARPSLAG